MRLLTLLTTSFLLGLAGPVTAMRAPCGGLFTKQPRELPDFTRAHARDVARIGTEIKRRFPPDRYAYLFVGRSPTPLLAYFELLHLDAYNLPLTNFKNTPRPVDWHLRGLDPGKPLSEEKEAALFDHFAKFLPNAFGGKRVLLIDFAVFGFRLNAAHLYVQRYYETRLPALVTEPFALHFAAGKMEILFCVPDADHEIRSQAGSVFKRMMGSKYEPFAKYGAFELGVDESPTAVNPAYELLKANLRGRLRL